MCKYTVYMCDYMPMYVYMYMHVYVYYYWKRATYQA